MPSGTLCVLRGCEVGQTTRSVADGIPTEDRGNEGERRTMAISEESRSFCSKYGFMPGNGDGMVKFLRPATRFPVRNHSMIGPNEDSTIDQRASGISSMSRV
jgi:hypothetical protein